MPQRRRYTVRVEVAWDPEQLIKLRWVAGRMGMSRAQLVRTATLFYADYLCNEEDRKAWECYRSHLAETETFLKEAW